jgi:hypothetical protein
MLQHQNMQIAYDAEKIKQNDILLAKQARTYTTFWVADILYSC